MNILLTNDDGIWAPGLRSLHQALTSAGHQVTVVAPLTEQSAVGHAVTLSSPLRIKKVNDGPFQGFGVSGSPVDCVKIALGTVYNLTPDVLISGINNGANVGVDILYSGTVAAATEAALVGIPALAVSIDHFNPEDFHHQAEYVQDFIQKIEWRSLPPRRVLNLNFPNLPLPECRGLRLCPQTQAVYEDWYEKRTDPRGRPYYWLCGEILAQNLEPDTDRTLLTQGYITLTPLTFDFTDQKLMQELSQFLGSSE
ncbi:MAG: 5'/3'-nucleotidase SurE [Desulfovermiculus sp.]